MRVALKTPDGRTVVVDTKADEALYTAPCNPPNTGTRYTRGKDLYAHKARSGKTYFYFRAWSLWQGEEDRVWLCSKEQAQEFLADKTATSGWEQLSEEEAEDLKRYGFQLYEETA
jgi:hypothetical protein